MLGWEQGGIMIQIGCLARFFNKYADEVEFATRNGFDFMQIWYDRNGIALRKDSEPKESVIKEFDFPTIVHAVLDINEFEEHVSRVIDILVYLNHKNVIIHPICESEEITSDTIHKLSRKVSCALEKISDKGITLYLENNSKIDPIFNTPEEIGIMFSSNPNLEFILDVAHIESYEHLKRIVDVKMPKILHIADKHFDIIHEHLPVGQGDIDYEYIFNNELREFTGKIILEVAQSDEAVISSRDKIRNVLSKS
jgi:sugar phosphate isomerase/epimerase